MEEFIKKWGGQGSQPFEAVEMIADKVHHLKQKVEQGDSHIIPQLQELSVILDEFAHYAKKGNWEPRQGGNYQPYQDYQGQQESNQPKNVYDPYRTVGRVGYGADNHWSWGYPYTYPVYPYFNESKGGQVGDGKIGYRPNDNEYWGDRYRPEYNPDYISPRNERGGDRTGRDQYGRGDNNPVRRR